MTIDDKIKDEDYNAILTEKQQKYQHYRQVKLSNMNILDVKKYYLLIKVEKQNKLSLHILHSVKHLKNKTNKKMIEDQGIKQVEALKAFRPEENQELETTEGLFPKKIRKQ